MKKLLVLSLSIAILTVMVITRIDPGYPERRTARATKFYPKQLILTADQLSRTSFA